MEFGWNDGVDGRAVIDKQHSHVGVFIIQVCESTVQHQSYGNNVLDVIWQKVWPYWNPQQQ